MIQFIIPLLVKLASDNIISSQKETVISEIEQKLTEYITKNTTLIVKLKDGIENIEQKLGSVIIERKTQLAKRLKDKTPDIIDPLIDDISDEMDILIRNTLDVISSELKDTIQDLATQLANATVKPSNIIRTSETEKAPEMAIVGPPKTDKKRKFNPYLYTK